MNHIHRLVWNQVTCTWVAVAENVRGRGKGSSRKLVAAALSLSASFSYAGPTGGLVTAGAATIAQSGAITTITQTTPNASLSFKSYNVAAHEKVNYVQPSVSSVAVNRIYDTNGSQILGQINANGQVYLINPNGILFGQGAVVNVGGLVASTLGFNDSALGSSAKTFAGPGTGSVINQGAITAAQGGYIALLGKVVSNTGTLNAPQGTVAMGGGSAATLTFANNSLVSLQIDQSTLDTLVENGGLIKADGGTVVMNAGAKESLLASVVNNTGIVQAQTVENRNGVITLLGGMAAGTVNVGGTLDASAPKGGDGGFIETSAAHVKITDGVAISTAAVTGKTGTWLIDPVDFTISAAGTGTVSGGTPSGDISNTTLQNALAGTDVTILSSQGSKLLGSGDINVNADVAWSAHQLTLTAARNVNVNAVMTASGTSKLVLNTSTANGADAAVPGGTVNMGFNADGTFKGKVNFDRVGTGFLQINGAAYTVVNSLGVAGDATVAPGTPTLQGIAAANTNFALGDNIDATATGAGGTFGTTGFTPIGNTAAPFAFSFNGLGHTITNLTTNQAAVANVGLIGIVGAITTSVGNVGLVGGSVAGGAGTGGLVGSSTATSINNSYSTGNVTGGAGVGGLMGATSSGAISNSYTTGTVLGGAGTGGLLGANVSGAVSDSYTTGNVTGEPGTGGLVGASTTANFTNVYTTGNVTGAAGTGGLVGTSTTGNFTNTYATGAVHGAAGTGGLVGTGTSGTLLKSYATGNVIGAAGTGGLIGTITSGLVDQSYALGNVKGDATTGGLVGSTTGTISNSYTMGVVDPVAGHGGLVGASTGPILNSYAGGASSSSVGGLASSNTSTTTDSYWDKTANPSTSVIGVGKTNTEMKTVTTFSTWDPNIWLIEAGKLPILKALIKTITVTATAADASKTYDGNVYSGFTASYSGGDTAAYSNTSLGFTGEAATAINAGSWAITPYGLTSTNAQYVFAYVNGVLTINPAPLTGVASRVYDAGTNIAGSLFSFTGYVGSDSISLSGTGTVASKNVGSQSVNGVGYTAVAGTGLASNYTFINGLTADISKANLTVTGLTAAAQTYTATTVATLGGTAAITKLGTDDITLGGTAAGAFVDKNVGTSKAITVTGNTVSGADVGNYTLVQQAGLSATVNKADLTVSGLTAATQTYTGTTVATLGGVAAVTALGTDSVTLSGTAAGAFVDKNVGSGKAIAVTGNTIGSTGDALNYNLVQQTGLSATVEKANLVITGVTADSRVYDAGTVATLSGTAIVSALASDVVTVGGTGVGAFDNKNVGTGKTVTASGYTFGGADAGNYNAAATLSSTADISPKVLTATVATVSKVYDGTTDATPALSIIASGLIGSETVTATGTGSYNSKNVGTATGVTVASTTLANGSNGGLATNYSLGAGQTGTGTITPKTVTLTAPTLSKIYDGALTYATQAFDLSALSAQLGVSGDSVGSAGLVYADKNVASNKTVTINALSISDGNTTPGANYTVTLAGNNTSSISRLSSVTWIGGATGNWFDPANWAGRAVPDLSNVANVVIPQGVTVSFDNANVVAPVQAGAVNVDTVGSAGNLSLLAGNLNVATSLQVTALTQTGGALTGGANIAVASFDQNGGSVATSGNFIASRSFTQAGVSTLAVGGNVGIAKAAGPVVLGNISAGGTLNVVAVGDINQLSPSTLVATGLTTLKSTGGNISLTQASNDFGTVNATAGNINLADANALNVALTASGNSVISSGGNLVVSGSSKDLTATTTNAGTTTLGATNVGGNLVVSSSGAVSQTDTLVLGGTSTATANGVVVAISTAAPTAAPSSAPTAQPTAAPTGAPTAEPTAAPTTAPTAAPASAPTAEVTQAVNATTNAIAQTQPIISVSKSKSSDAVVSEPFRAGRLSEQLLQFVDGGMRLPGSLMPLNEEDANKEKKP